MPILLMFIVCSIATLCSSVYAVWTYCNNQIQPNSDVFSAVLAEFIYTPEDVLPDEGFDERQENHLYLIRNILDHATYGINDGDKKVIHDYLKSYGAIYGAQNVSGGNLKHILATESSVAGKVQFAMKKISDTEYHAFTFSQDDLEKSIDGAYIEVYKTVMEYQQTEQGEMRWVDTRGYKGQAKTGWCQTDKKDVYSILIDTWEET